MYSTNLIKCFQKFIYKIQNIEDIIVETNN